MKKCYLFLLSALVALNLLGCAEELEHVAILLDEADSVISDSLGEDEYENLYDFEIPEINFDSESTENSKQIDSDINTSEESEFQKDSKLDLNGDNIPDPEQVLDDINASTVDASYDFDGKITVIGDETDVVGVSDELKIPSTDEYTLDIDGTYTTAEDVSLYIYLYDELPENFITKSEARELGWSGGGLDDYAPGMCIGGDYFGNREGLLPKAKGRTYTECDINTLGEDSRGAERIVFSNDGLIYYTDDHYESFVLLYDEDGMAA